MKTFRLAMCLASLMIALAGCGDGGVHGLDAAIREMREVLNDKRYEVFVRRYDYHIAGAIDAQAIDGEKVDRVVAIYADGYGSDLERILATVNAKHPLEVSQEYGEVMVLLEATYSSGDVWKLGFRRPEDSFRWQVIAPMFP